MEKKFELVLSDVTEIAQTKLYRIKALKNFGNVKKGDLGGYVETEANLSHDGDCWIYDFGKVHDLALVSGNARVKGNAEMHDQSTIYDKATIDGNCQLWGKSQVYEQGTVSGVAKLHDNVQVYGGATVTGKSDIYGDIQIHNKSKIIDKTIKYEWDNCREIYYDNR